jgi:hypothetical protein
VNEHLSAPSSSAGARYELTISGRIGPVLRHALRLDGPGAARECVVLQAGGPSDLVGLLRVLDAHGLEVDHVSQLPTPDRDG